MTLLCRDLYRKGLLEESRVELDLDSLGLNEQGGGGGMGTHGNPLQAFAAMMEAMSGRAGGRGAGGRQQGKASMTVRWHAGADGADGTLAVPQT